jgi:PAS domain S-box-containing protein
MRAELTLDTPAVNASPTPTSAVAILVVDDDRGKRLAIRSVLAQLGHTIVEAESGESALREVLRRTFAVILMDVQMPEWNGYETARLIRLRRESEHTPIIFLTAYPSDDAQLLLAYGSGAVDFIFAPIVPAILRAKVSIFVDLFLKTRDLEQSLGDVTMLSDQFRDSEERFRLIAEHAQDLIALLDTEGRFRYLSPSCESILGFPAGALLGTAGSELIHPDDWPPGTKWGARKLREMRWRKTDGSWLWVEGLSYPVTGQGGSQFAVIARDISERKRAEAGRQQLEEELRQAQKMEAVGQLAGGIAHDFNNLLTVISGYTEILLRRLGREGEGSREIAEVGKAAEKAARLTRQLLAYSRKQVLEPRILDLNNVVIETQAMFERVIGDHIEVSTALAANPSSISADQGQIEQIVMNLVVNARDAMPEGGRLLLRTDNITIADDSVATTPGDYVALTVTDNGHGMDAETTGRIFEPFYTTKERDAGTGLGLSTVYGIIKQSGGHIEVDSRPGRGTTFRLSFPCVSAEPEAFSAKPLDERLLIGSETILLVEDEQAVRDLGKAMLETYGYTVLLADDGAAALELAQAPPQPIRLLMTDIMMPRMGGIELADRLTAVCPDLKVVYTSGYNDNGHDLQKREGASYLQKPYAMEALARALRDLLDAA